MGVFVDGLAITLGRTVTAGPVRTVIFQLQSAVVLFMAQQTAVFTNPFHATVFTIVEVGYFSFLPSVSETKYINFDWNSFHPYLLATQTANLLLEITLLAVNNQGRRYAALNSSVHFRTHVLQKRQDRG
jgi:hypothetical protein